MRAGSTRQSTEGQQSENSLQYNSRVARSSRARVNSREESRNLKKKGMMKGNFIGFIFFPRSFIFRQFYFWVARSSRARVNWREESRNLKRKAL